MLAPVRKLGINDKVSETYTSVSENISEAVVTIPTKPYRSCLKYYLFILKGIKLDLDLQAPEVVLPKSFDSTSRLVIQLGHLIVTNKFFDDVRDTKAVPIDNIHARIFGVKLFTVIDDVACALTSELSVEASVIRALVPSTPQFKV